MFIKRYLLDEIIAHLPKREITLIVGPRQAGKTTLMMHLKDYLEKRREQTLFLSLDFEMDMPYFKSQAELLQRIRLEFGGKKGYVFIDEIQRKENAGLFLKGIYDMQTPYKFIVSGSGSLELKEKIQESLAGRKRLCELYTVSFKEFVNYKTFYRYEDRLSEYFSIKKEDAMHHFKEYLNFGGYPAVILEETISEKIKIMNEIYRSYVDKDITHLISRDRIDTFNNMLRLLAGQIGNMLNYNELSSTLGISLQTVKNYLSWAEKTFVIKRVTPYFKNIRKEISKSPVVYFTDTGMRNFAMHQFGRVMGTEVAGFLFQNFVYRLLLDTVKDDMSTIHYWRTKDKAEVDFVIDMVDRVVPVEVKCREMKKAEIRRSTRSFIEKYEPDKVWIVNLTLKAEEKIGKTKILFIPFFELV